MTINYYLSQLPPKIILHRTVKSQMSNNKMIQLVTAKESEFQLPYIAVDISERTVKRLTKNKKLEETLSDENIALNFYRVRSSCSELIIGLIKT